MYIFYICAVVGVIIE